MKSNNPVSEIMSTALITVRLDTSIQDIRTIFKENNIHHLPVVADGEAVVGILSKEDLTTIAYGLSLNTSGKTFTEKTYASLTAKEMMTKNPMLLDSEDTIGLAADIFMANRFHALPIVEDNRLVGIVTSHDLLKYAFTQIEEEV